MAESVYNYPKLEIKMLNLENFICFDNLTLNFNSEKYCVVISGTSDSMIQVHKCTIFSAFQFIFHTNYINVKKAKNLLKRNCNGGHVKVVFQLNKVQITATRAFENLEEICIIENDIERQLNFKLFLMTYANPLNDFSYENFTANANLLDTFYKSLWQSNEYFEMDSINIEQNKFSGTQQLDSSIPKNLLLRHLVLNYEDKLRWIENAENIKTFISVTNTINEIFQKLTYDNYKVKFLIPYPQRMISTNIKDFMEIDANLSLEFLNKNITTIIISSYDSSRIIWTNAEKHIILLLKLSAQIALTILHKQNIIFIENLSDLEFIQNEELFKTAIVNNYCLTSNSASEDLKLWQYKNFVNKIIDICQEKEILAIILFDDYVPIIKNANIICCKKQSNEIKCEVRDEMMKIEYTLQKLNNIVNIL